MANDQGHLKVLLLIAAVLLMFGLGLDDSVVSWALGPGPTRVSAYEDQHTEEVRHLLQLDQARRSGGAGEKR